MAVWFVLDSLHASYAAVIAALHTVTSAKYAGTVVQSIRDASHDATIKLVKANITDAERTGSLAVLARTEYGVGIFKDEYPTHAAKELEAFNLLGESGRETLHYEAPDEPNGSWVWSAKSLPDSDGSGRTYGDRIVGAPVVNGPYASVTAPSTSKADLFYHGFFIGVWPGAVGGRTIARFASLDVFNGQDALNRIGYHFNHWLKPGAISQGLILQHESSWVKDSVTNAYSIVEGSSSHNAENGGLSKHYDPDFDTLEFTGELTPASSVANCKATPGNFYWEGGADTWWVHMPDGTSPAGRVVGTGDFGFRFDFSGQLVAESDKEFTEWFGYKGRQSHLVFKPADGITDIHHHTFHMLNMRYGTGAADNHLIHPQVQTEGVGFSVTDMIFNIDQLSRANAGFYMISQDGEADAGSFARFEVRADVNARDGRENIFDIGKVGWEVHTDNHAVGIQMVDTMTVEHLKVRRCGGSIVAYFRNWVNPALNTTNRPVKDIVITNNDVREHGAEFVTGGSNAVGIAINSDNALQYPVTGVVIRDNIVRGYDTNASKAMTYCIRNTLPDQVIMEGNDCDLAVVSQVDMAKSVTRKSVLLSGSSGDWAVDDFIEDDAAPGVKIGRVVKITGSDPTKTLHYIHPTSQTTTAADISASTAINNTSSGAGTTNGAPTAVVLGSNTLIRESVTQRSCFGNSGGTALALRAVTGATFGGSDAIDRLTGGVYIQESDSDFVGAADHDFFNFTQGGVMNFTEYGALSHSGNSYGSGSSVVAS